MFDLNEEMRKAAEKIQERMLKDMMFGPERSSPFVSTARMATSINRQPLTLRAFPHPLFDVITSPYVVKKKKRSREEKRTFWQRLWAGLTDLNPWPYCPIEYYEVEVPTIAIDRRNNMIICHPSLEQEIKKAVREGGIR